MSLEALAIALTADLDNDASLTLIHLADGANDRHVTVPNLSWLASKVRVDEDQLRVILDELIGRGLISSVAEHPFDFVSDSEGFVLNLGQVPSVPYVESPWSKQLRLIG